MATYFSNRKVMLFVAELWCFWAMIHPATGIRHAEAEALIEWKNTLSNCDYLSSSWTVDRRDRNGKIDDVAPCDWFGIECGRSRAGGQLGRRVVRLNMSEIGVGGELKGFPFSSLRRLHYMDLSYNNFTGLIPAEIGELRNIRYIDLGYNKLSGVIPAEIGFLVKLRILHLPFCQLSGSIPVNIGQLKNLTELGLHGNILTGSVPDSIGNLSNLNTLFLFDNQLSGLIPPQIGNLRNLKFIGFEKNQFYGHIPSSFGNLSSLRSFIAYENLLSGGIPEEMGNLKYLRVLSLSYNNLSGGIPASFGRLGRLRILHLYQNRLEGELPRELGQLTSLIQFEVSDNMLTGSVPAELNNLTSLQALNLRNNTLSGILPDLSGLGNLLKFQLGSNHFSGNLPDIFCSEGKLLNISVANNDFHGDIPTSLMNCTSLNRLRLDGNRFDGNISKISHLPRDLQYMDLSNNHFVGKISSEWGKCSNLMNLAMSKNNITGQIPAALGNLSKLQLLDLSFNNLDGEIPHQLHKASLLWRLVLNDNRLSGNLPLEFSSISRVSYIDLSANRLSGDIPNWFGNFSDLNFLYLSKNQFSGRFPLSVTQLLQLNELDLSYNLIEGEIPVEINKLKSLQMLNLSHNNFSGSIPEEIAEMSILRRIDLSYNNLEGPVPNGKIFSDAPKALRGNKGLCGNLTELNPCKSMSKGSKTNTLHIILFSGIGSLVLLACGSLLFLLWRSWSEKNSTGKSPANLVIISSKVARVTYNEIIVATENFDEKFCIGEGKFGKVYKAHLRSSEIVAVKKLHQSPEVGNNGFANEIMALTNIRHRNIVKLYGYYSDESHSLLVYEYMEKGSLAAVLRDEESAQDLDWTKRLGVIRAVAEALSYMHHSCTPSIVHRDVSGGNILLDSDYGVRVSDFGLAKLLRSNSLNQTVVAGTIGYMAPELAYAAAPTAKSDVYSFGVLIIEIIMGRHPRELLATLYNSFTPATEELLDSILDERLSTPSNELQKHLLLATKVALMCLKIDPFARPTMLRVVNILTQTTASTSPAMASPAPEQHNSSSQCLPVIFE